MSQHHNQVADFSRDLGAWAGESMDIEGVDELSLLARTAAVALDIAAIQYEIPLAAYLVAEDHIFEDDQLVAPPVLGDVRAPYEPGPPVCWTKTPDVEIWGEPPRSVPPVLGE